MNELLKEILEIPQLVISETFDYAILGLKIWCIPATISLGVITFRYLF